MKRQRCDSAAGQIAAFHGAATPVEPPEKLKVAEMKIWHEITATRARQDWTPADLRHAVNLCRTFVLIEKLHKTLARAESPEKVVGQIEKLTRLSLSMSAKLQIHALATVGRSADAVQRNTAQREAGLMLSGIEKYIKRPEQTQ